MVEVIVGSKMKKAAEKNATFVNTTKSLMCFLLLKKVPRGTTLNSRVLHCA